MFDDHRRTYALEQISHHIQNWDGSFPHDVQNTESNNKFTLTAFLNINIVSFGTTLECQFLVRCQPERHPIVPKKLEHCGGNWYGPLPINSFPEFHTTDLPDSDIPIRLQPLFFLRQKPKVLILVQTHDSNLTGYLFSRTHVIGDKVLILTCEKEVEQVKIILKQLNAGNEVKPLEVRKGLPSGWIAFEPFIVKNRAHNCPVDFEHLQPESQTKIWLEGGLLLDRLKWLDGAEPQIRIRREIEPHLININSRDVALTPDGKIQNPEEIITAPDSYYVRVGKKMYKNFSILSPDWPFSFADQSYEPIWQFKLSNDGYTKPSKKENGDYSQIFFIRGALIEGELPKIVIPKLEQYSLKCLESEKSDGKTKYDRAWFNLVTKYLVYGQTTTTNDAQLFDREKRIFEKAPFFHQTLLYKQLSQEHKTRLAFVLANKNCSFQDIDAGKKS